MEGVHPRGGEGALASWRMLALADKVRAMSASEPRFKTGSVGLSPSAPPTLEKSGHLGSETAKRVKTQGPSFLTVSVRLGGSWEQVPLLGLAQHLQGSWCCGLPSIWGSCSPFR